MTKKELLDKIKDDFEKTKNDQSYTQNQKNEKYASLMTLIEKNFEIPVLLVNEDINQLQFDEPLTLVAFAFYQSLSEARNFNIY